MKFNRDCKSFPGNYACEIMTSENLKDCSNCKFYEPISKRILIIKLGAMGDVLRTTPLLPALKKKHGSNIYLTWLVKEESLPLLEKNPHIDRILTYNLKTIQQLAREKFSILINLDLDPEATSLSNEIRADEKYGYFLDEDGHPSPFNKSAEFYLHRALSNQINLKNRKTYQEMIFEIAELEYNKEEIILNNMDESYAKNFMKDYSLTKEDKILGVNIGSSGRWPSKALHQDNIIELIKKLKDKYKIILLGGPEEKETLPNLHKKAGIPEVLTSGTSNNLPKFISLLNICDLIITGDTLALHLATALKKKTIALFFSTPPWEIEDYNLVKKITSPKLKENFYIDYYNEDLTKSISTEEVLRCLKNI